MIGTPLFVLAVAVGAVGLRDTPVLQGRRAVVLATTTSARDVGLLDSLLPPFEREYGRRVKVIAVGTGQAMELGRRGEADLLLVHDPPAVRAFLEAGYGIEAELVMYNEFVIVGPPSDLAGVRRAGSAPEALKAIALRGGRFLSRGDRSGTHAREIELWRRAGLDPKGPWYRESGQGMSATLQIASELGAYTLTDIGTFLAHRHPLALELLFSGDTALFNLYHVVLVNPGKFPRVEAEGARRLKAYLLSERGQDAIEAFGRARFGRSLFLPARKRAGGR